MSLKLNLRGYKSREDFKQYNELVKYLKVESNATEEFEKYAEKVKSLPDATNEDLLIIYGLFKQATVGDVNTTRPGIFDQKGRAKWDAWKGNEGKCQDDAMSDYITKAKQLLEAAGLSA